MSLAHVLSTVPGSALPKGNILFLEDLNEDLYRILRAFDSAKLTGLFDGTRAIVLGNFSDCTLADSSKATEAQVASLVARKMRLPVYVLPVFGHDRSRLPLIYGANVEITQKEGVTLIRIGFDAGRTGKGASLGASESVAGRFLPRASENAGSTPGKGNKPRVHFTGIGGTGMAAVAGLFAADGYSITGSDGPIYPPMDKTLRDIGVEPKVGFTAGNLIDCKPDAVVLANVVSRRNAELKPNLEFEALLGDSIPLFSFPSALRHFFLHRARNVVVSGTHGKTTTTSLMAHLLTELGQNPSFMIGGSPKNFGIGFALRNPGLFVLEGDEYDSALFDKGPKFLHYEPTVALINNIEFDHADIYADVEAIEREFERLCAVCEVRSGVVVANAGDPRVLRIASEFAKRVLWFGEGKDGKAVSNRPMWTLVSHIVTRTGMNVSLRTPWGETRDCPMGLFGSHNALNAMATLASLHALHLHGKGLGEVDFSVAAQTLDTSFDLEKALAACATFEGVKRRFELVGIKGDVSVFDDFAHHPTAIDTTLGAFKAYRAASGATGRLVACFDPRNATMRRRVLQEQLTRSFGNADLVFLGKVAVDKRLAEGETLDGPEVARAIGASARYFGDNDEMCETLKETLRPGDTVVFMSSGAFDGLPGKLLAKL